MLKQIAALALVVAFVVVPCVLLAVDSDASSYIGGTLTLKEHTDGKLSTQSEADAVFTPKDKHLTAVSIPYGKITGLEYGEKAGRRVAVAVMVSPLALFSKKRNHYLTISFKDSADKEQAGVFELGKDIVRTTLKALQVRSGKTVEYQDEEARKSGMGS